MNPLEMIDEWRKGCTCAGPAFDKMLGNKPGTTQPEECHECTRALIDAIERKLRAVQPVTSTTQTKGNIMTNKTILITERLEELRRANHVADLVLAYTAGAASAGILVVVLKIAGVL